MHIFIYAIYITQQWPIYPENFKLLRGGRIRGK